MSLAKVSEVTCESEKSFEDAIANGIKEASKTVRDIKSAWIAEQKVIVKNDKIVEYRVTMRITFVLHRDS
ncbi:MAG: dodecin family protein [Gammaproteobacteria bacterium]|nr:dodecin family protein [Gammaproteobacteria bacterium]